MTTLGVIADIHGNLVALDAVLAALDEIDIDRIICCGDILGMVGWPEETAMRVREKSDITVYGNHDAVLRGDHSIRIDSQGGSGEARAFDQQLSATTVDWIDSLPGTVETNKYLVTHAYPAEWSHCHCGHNQSAIGIPERRFPEVSEAVDAEFVLLGHTHQQAAFDASTHTNFDTTVINPGSIGVPWDNETAEYAIVDLKTNEYQLKKTSYVSAVVKDRFEDLRLE